MTMLEKLQKLVKEIEPWDDEGYDFTKLDVRELLDEVVVKLKEMERQRV